MLQIILEIVKVIADFEIHENFPKIFAKIVLNFLGSTDYVIREYRKAVYTYVGPY
jgi:hypothetical protein